MSVVHALYSEGSDVKVTGCVYNMQERQSALATARLRYCQGGTTASRIICAICAWNPVVHFEDAQFLGGNFERKWALETSILKSKTTKDAISRIVFSL